ncbi:hypothetical protein I316_08046, partial [Kwoniella heveanensis BCC8398]
MAEISLNDNEASSSSSSSSSHPSSSAAFPSALEEFSEDVRNSLPGWARDLLPKYQRQSAPIQKAKNPAIQAPPVPRSPPRDCCGLKSGSVATDPSSSAYISPPASNQIDANAAGSSSTRLDAPIHSTPLVDSVTDPFDGFPFFTLPVVSSADPSQWYQTESVRDVDWSKVAQD